MKYFSSIFCTFLILLSLGFAKDVELGKEEQTSIIYNSQVYDLNDNPVHQDPNQSREQIDLILEDLIKRLEYDMSILANEGLEHIEDGDFIILHAVEEPVELLLPEAKRMGKEFKVLILMQDEVKTQQVIQIMEQNGIEYTVIPEWDLIHFFDRVNKLFIGAYAVTTDGKFVSDSGTSNIVSECHIHNLPVYLFSPVLEITPTISENQNIYLKEESQNIGQLDYTLISHSSDIVSLDLVDHLITDKGEIDKDKIAEYCIV